MTQTASFNSKLKTGFSVFKWELRNCSGALTVYAILSAVALTVTLTLALLVGFSEAINQDRFNFDAISASINVFQLVASYAVYYINAVFTIVYTIRIFSYLHNKRKADMYGAMPVSRRTFFLSKTASAFLLSVVPTLFFFGVIAVISVCFGQPLVEETCKLYVELPLGAAACISFYALLAVCCGTTVNSVLTFVAVNFAYPVTALFIKGTLKSFFCGIPTGNYSGSFIMKALNPLAAYDGTNIIYWLLFTAACLALGTFLVKKRKAECAQTSFAYYLPCYIVKLLIAFIFGMFLGTVFASIAPMENPFVFFVFGFALGSVPAHIITHLIFYKGMEKLAHTLIPLAALFVTVTGLMAFCTFDPFGYNTYVPDPADIRSAGLVDMSDCYQAKTQGTLSLLMDASDDFTDAENIREITAFHKDVVRVTDRPASEKFRSVWINLFASNIPSELLDEGYGIAYKLNNGLTVTRYFDNMSTSFSDKTIETGHLKKVTSTKEYFANYNLIMNIPAENITKVIFNSDLQGRIEIDTENGKNRASAKQDIARLVEAYRRDRSEKSVPSTDDTLSFEIYYNPIRGNYGNSFLDMLIYSESLYSNRQTYEIAGEYTETMAALEAIGVMKNGSYNSDSPYYISYNY